MTPKEQREHEEFDAGCAHHDTMGEYYGALAKVPASSVVEFVHRYHRPTPTLSTDDPAIPLEEDAAPAGITQEPPTTS